MEMMMNYGAFEMLSENELMSVDGGGFLEDVWNETCKGIASAAAGATAGAKIGAITCNPVGFVAGVAVGCVTGVVWDHIMK